MTIFGDIFHSLRCDCGSQLDFAMRKIVENGSGIIVYLRQEGRGIGLRNKIKAYKLQQEKNLDTVEANNALGFKADLRDYGVGAQILKDLGAKELIVMTNNPKKIELLTSNGITVKERVPLKVSVNPNNENYLKTKAKKRIDELNEAKENQPTIGSLAPDFSGPTLDGGLTSLSDVKTLRTIAPNFCVFLRKA